MANTEPSQRALFPGCKFLYQMSNPDVAVVEMFSLLGVLSGHAHKRFVVDRNSSDTIADAEFNLQLNVMRRDIANGRAPRALDELRWWVGHIGLGSYRPRPKPGEAYRPTSE